MHLYQSLSVLRASSPINCRVCCRILFSKQYYSTSF